MKPKLLLLWAGLSACLLTAQTAPAPESRAMFANAPEVIEWNAPTMTLLSDEPVEYGFISTDPSLGVERLFSDQLPTGMGGRLFRGHNSIPSFLNGRYFFRLNSAKPHTFKCEKSGEAIALVFEADKDAYDALRQQGFVRKAKAVTYKQYEMFPCREMRVLTKQIVEGERITLPARTALAGVKPPCREQGGEVLPSGIILSKQWPPRIDPKSNEPMPVPYLQKRPEVVYIDLGRQLFIDDFLVEKTNLTREFHTPQKYEGNPVLKPETELERKSRFGDRPVAAPLGGSIWWNSDKQVFEMWYEAGHVSNLAYAFSKDGLKWERPNLDLVPGTNKIIEEAPDSWSVVRDLRDPDASKRYKMVMRPPDMDTGHSLAYTSADGTNWKLASEGGRSGDRVTFFYNPVRKKWVMSLRWFLEGGPGRSRAYVESDDFLQGANWLPSEPVFWARTDKLDKQILTAADLDPKAAEHSKRFLDKDGNYNFEPQLYNIDTAAYESIFVSFFQIFYGPENSYYATLGLGKITGLNFAYSRDGFHWDRPDRNLALVSTRKPGDWDRGYVQSVGNLCAIRGDKLLIYYTAFAGNPDRPWDPKVERDIFDSAMHDEGAMGVAFLRRDGFASLNADKGGELTTRPIVFSGKHLFVNVEAPKGKLLAQVCDAQGNPIAPFTFENCEPVSGDTTMTQVKWKGGSDLSKLAQRAVRVQFKLEDAKFYAFWVSRDDSGRSDGYVAGGGPGFTCDMDTVGKAAYEAEQALSESIKK